MSSIAPGWYKDPVDPTVQRYWDGEGWAGPSIPADATPPSGPPPVAEAVPAPAVTPGPERRPPDAPAAPSAPPLPPGWPTGLAHPNRRAVPPPRPHGLTLAGVGSRFVARLVDTLAVLGLVAVANAWFAYQWWQAFVPFLRRARDYQLNGGPVPETPAAVFNLFAMMCLVATAVWFAYEVPGSANSGQTLGKRLLGIKVVRVESAETLGFGRAFRRWGRLGLPTLLWSCYGIGLILQLLDCLFVAIDRPLHQALHDKAAATVVVQVPRPHHGEKSSLEHASSGGTHADPS